MTDAQVAAYLAKYATKSTEVTGHASNRLTGDTIDIYADPAGSHTERLIDACWMLGTPRDWRRLRRWAHMLGFGGHFLTKSRRYSITFALLRNQRIVFRRAQSSGPQQTAADTEPTHEVLARLDGVSLGRVTTREPTLEDAYVALVTEQPIAEDG